MSTQDPWLEKYARSSPRVDAPTVTAFSAAAGEYLQASLLSLPAKTRDRQCAFATGIIAHEPAATAK
jgi:hypothetical protein